MQAIIGIARLAGPHMSGAAMRAFTIAGFLLFGYSLSDCPFPWSCQSPNLVSAEPLCAAIWSVLLLLISYCGSLEVA